MSAPNFGDFYRQRSRPVISFEVFPPKSDAAYDNLRQILPELARLNPDFMTVTYGAMGSTQERTLEIAAMIQKQHSIPTACHLTCVGSSRAQLNDIIQQIYDSGIRNIVALRGDPPKGETQFTPAADGLSHANQLVAHIRNLERERGLERFGIAVAGYPEKHVEAPDLSTDMQHLKTKAQAGADIVVTQLFYDNQKFFDFVDKGGKLGIAAPIVPGLLPIIAFKQVMKIVSLCGSCLPQNLQRDLESAGDDNEKAEAIGVDHCVAQARELLDRGAPGIHFYVLNKATHMVRIMEKLFPERLRA